MCTAANPRVLEEREQVIVSISKMHSSLGNIGS